MYEKMTNLSPVSKTLRFSLRPIGATEKNFDKNLLPLELYRTEMGEIVKEHITRVHRDYLASKLEKLAGKVNIRDYVDFYLQEDKSEEDFETLLQMEAALREQISLALTESDEYKKLFKADTLYREILPATATNEKEIEAINAFSKSTTILKPFVDSQSNRYTAEQKRGAVATRIINDNLPRFISNMQVFNLVKSSLKDELLANAGKDLCTGDFTPDDYFSPDFFSFTYSQKGIDAYNLLIGGYSKEDGTKVQGLNELVNEYNMQNKAHIPLFRKLHKQILSDAETASFVSAKYTSDDECLGALNDFYSKGENDNMGNTLRKAASLLHKLREFDLSRIYVDKKFIPTLSNGIYHKWNAIEEKWMDRYDANYDKKKTAKYEDNRAAEYKKIRAFSIESLMQLCDDVDISAYLNEQFSLLSEKIYTRYGTAEQLLTKPYTYKKKLCMNDGAIDIIRHFADSIKDCERFLLMFNSTESTRDLAFYGDFDNMMDKFYEFNKIYDKTRNHCTSKPYSKDKIRLMFGCNDFAGGWDTNKTPDRQACLLRKGDEYYFAVTASDKFSKKYFKLAPTVEPSEDSCDLLEYFQIPDPSRDLPHIAFCAKGRAEFNPSDEILRIYETRTFIKNNRNFNIEDCHKLIDYYKNCLARREAYQVYGFKFSDTATYQNIGEFFKEVANQGYKTRYRTISMADILQQVEDEKMYLFRIWCRDFSPTVKGKPNLETMYFREIFSEENMAESIYRLKGGAEVYLREPSISKEELIVHPANQPMVNKNPLWKNKTAIRPYNIIKNERFTKRQFALHLAVMCNASAPKISRYNDIVNNEIRQNPNQHIIAIKRGINNLVYITVLDDKGEIIESRSMNVIEQRDKHGQVTQILDYRNKIAEIEDERDGQRKNWKAVSNIKNIKDGYMSQVVGYIADLVLKYDAVIAIESLSDEFKDRGSGIEKAVFKAFEKKLQSKLAFLVKKTIAPDQPGGIRKPLQLCSNSQDASKWNQNGIIFHISPAFTVIDPISGYYDTIRPQYQSIEKSKNLINKFDSIVFDKQSNSLSLSYNADNFGKNIFEKKEWTIAMKGEREVVFRDPNKNNQLDKKLVVLEDEFFALLEEYGVNLDEKDLKEEIKKQTEKDFFKRFVDLLAIGLRVKHNGHIISPVGFDSRTDTKLTSADMIATYNLARKGNMVLDKIRSAQAGEKVKTYISAEEWMHELQTRV